MNRSLAAILLLFQLASTAVAFQTLGSRQAATGRGRRPMPKLFQRNLKEVDCTTSSEDEWDESCFEDADAEDADAGEDADAVDEDADAVDEDADAVDEDADADYEDADALDAEASYLEAGPGSNSRKAAVIVPSVFAALALLVGAALIATRHRRNQQEEDNTTTEFIEIGCVSHSHDYFCGSASAVA